jgi:diacylglycerol kinase (ATP)
MKRLINSFGFAFKGLRYATATQPNFRIHLALAIIAVVLGFLLQISFAEWEWIMLAIALVLIVELLNTSIETLVDLVSPGYHEMAGRVKDVCAGAVVIAAVFALVTGIVIFLPKLISLVTHAA